MSIHGENNNEFEIVSCDTLVPRDHLVRKLKNAIDYTFIYELVSPYYSDLNGRPSVDPIIIFKILIIKYIFGIKSVRQTIKDIDVNIAYRWYLGFSLTEKIPHFTLINTNYYRRFKDTDVFEKIFNQILDKAIDMKMVSMDQAYIDSTHIKANANKKKFIVQEIEKEKKAYEEELLKDINEDRVKNGKKEFAEAKQEIEVKKINKTDPESGYYCKGEKERVFAYSAHVAVDNKGFVLDVHVTPGNVHDSQAFYPLYDSLMNKFDEKIQAVVMDVGYKTPGIAKKILDNNKLPILPYKRPMTEAGFFKKYEYIYDKEKNVYICPNGQVLRYTTTNRNGYREYKSVPEKCKNCPLLNKCTKSKNTTKVILRHIWQDSLDYAEELRKTDYHKEVYKKRKETVERQFGEGKENNTLRYTRYKGVKKNQNYITLLFACMNLKKLALWTDKRNKKYEEYKMA